MGYDAKAQQQARKKTADPEPEAGLHGSDINEPGNQLLLRRMGQTQAGSLDLEQVIKGRLHEMYSANQIPAAEREADRISSSINGAASPESVKASLGARIGADFSGVRFHADAEAADRAGNIGAKAYTTGGDIYFGRGGFDPVTAAHELVHTVQQGTVESAISTVSAPSGGVQMAKDGSAGGGGLFGWMKKLFGKGDTGAAQPPVAAQPPAAVQAGPADLKLGWRAGTKSMKGKAVTSMPTVSGDKAVVKAGTNPDLEGALADFYNVAGELHGARQPGAWGFDAPKARGLRQREKSGIGSLFKSGKMAAPGLEGAPQPPRTQQLAGTTVFDQVGGMSVRDPVGDKAQSDKLPGELHEDMYNGPDLQQYQETMGYVSLMDLVSGDSDRHSAINFNNWMEDRDQKKVHLIDNAYDHANALGYRTPEVDAATNQRDWQASARHFTGANTPGGASAASFQNGWLGNSMSDPALGGLFGAGTGAGISQAIGDLPAIRAALQARFQEQSASGAPGAERAQFNQDLLARLDMLQAMFNPPQAQQPPAAVPNPAQVRHQPPAYPLPPTPVRTPAAVQQGVQTPPPLPTTPAPPPPVRIPASRLKPPPFPAPKPPGTF